MITPSDKLELHYYFSDNSHSMNATIRNECERELLLILKELIFSLDVEIEIDSEAFLEGGLKNWWKAFGKNSAQITLILAVLTVILSRIPVENKELVKLQIENLKLDNEIKKNELKKIKQEVKTDEDVTNEIVEKVIEKLDNDYKIIWHKSNFFKKLNFYLKVDKISTQLLDNNNKPTNPERTVFRNQFPLLIVHSDRFPPFIDDEALIDIVSPVLTKGNFQWKGIYKGQVLSFEMKDKDFKNSVLNIQVEFVNGIAIKCVLQQNRKIDEVGIIQTVNSQVLTVLEIVESNNTIETDQGKKYRKDKKESDKQMKLFQ